MSELVQFENLKGEEFWVDRNSVIAVYAHTKHDFDMQNHPQTVTAIQTLGASEFYTKLTIKSVLSKLNQEE